jgi:hypothetical protein
MFLNFVDFSQNCIIVNRLNKKDWYTDESWCSRTSIFGISTFHDDFNAIVETFREWLLRIKVTPRDWRVGFAHFTAISQIILSPVKLCLLLSEVECFRALWNVVLLQPFNVA